MPSRSSASPFRAIIATTLSTSTTTPSRTWSAGGATSTRVSSSASRSSRPPSTWPACSTSGAFRGYPHETTDSLMIAAGLVDQLQTLVSRRVSPLEAAVVTVGTLHAGTAPNIIPGAANLTGTVRTLSEKLRVKIERELTGLVEHFARAHGGSAEVKYMHGSPVLENHRGLVEFLKRPRPRRSRATRWSTWRRRWAPKTS